LYAILFIIFDVEAVFIFPWALSFVGIGPMAYWTMVTFIGILSLGLAYAWKKGALQWR
jgi:NADH-quinone oxidoreductase subunit A